MKAWCFPTLERKKKNSNKKGGGCAILEASFRHCIREEEISFELIPRPLTDEAEQMDVENPQCMEGLVTSVIMSAWRLPRRPSGFMPLTTLQIGHNPISPAQGHNLAAHLWDSAVEFRCPFLCAWAAQCLINWKTNQCCETLYLNNTDFYVLLRNFKLSVFWPNSHQTTVTDWGWGMWVSRSPSHQQFVSGCTHTCTC